MIEIIDEIDAYTSTFAAAYAYKNWGFCELSYKSAKDANGALIGPSGSQPIVMTGISTTPNGNRNQVTLDDKYQFITWIRWVEPAKAEINDDWSFGREEAEENTLSLRIVVAYKSILGENLIFTFAKGLPKRMELTGFKYIFMDGRPSIDPDHETIYQTELGNTAYEKHRFAWNLYVVDVSYQFIEC